MNHLTFKKALIYCIISAGAWHLASLGGLYLFFLPLFFYALLRQSEVKQVNHAFYLGLLNGLLIYSIHLRFFKNIFPDSAFVLWTIISFWIGLFLLGAHLLKKYLPANLAAGAIPLLFFSLEFVRSELYILKFSWGSIGFHTYQNPASMAIQWSGLYGFGFIIFLIVSTCALLKTKAQIISLSSLGILLALLTLLPNAPQEENNQNPLISGIQLEFPTSEEVIAGLDKTLHQYPQTDIFLLSEYTFKEIPAEIFKWCKSNKKYLVAGAKFKTADKKNFYNTATVINPLGEIEFKQVKCTPIQFFADGLAATQQQLWHSPWGKMGLCICYDLSYAQVTDELIRQGAQALLIPTMDVEHWGENQHLLHSRVAPVKATEYGIAIFKVCSSGISQFVDAKGNILSSAPFPGQGEMLSARLPLTDNAQRPADRFFIYLALPLSCLLLIFAMYKAFLEKRKLRPAVD